MASRAKARHRPRAHSRPTGIRALIDRLPKIGAYVVSIAAPVGVIYGAWTWLTHLRPDRCAELAQVNWAGWECNPPTAKVMVGGCGNTKEVAWLDTELHRLVSAGYLQSPYPSFKLVPAEMIDGRIPHLWLCEASDTHCINHQKNKEKWFAVWVGEPTSLGRSISIIGSVAGYGSQRSYLDKDGVTWCGVNAGQLKPINLPTGTGWFGRAFQ